MIFIQRPTFTSHPSPSTFLTSFYCCFCAVVKVTVQHCLAPPFDCKATSPYLIIWITSSHDPTNWYLFLANCPFCREKNKDPRRFKAKTWKQCSESSKKGTNGERRVLFTLRIKVTPKMDFFSFFILFGVAWDAAPHFLLFLSLPFFSLLLILSLHALVSAQWPL